MTRKSMVVSNNPHFSNFYEIESRLKGRTTDAVKRHKLQLQKFRLTIWRLKRNQYTVLRIYF